MVFSREVTAYQEYHARAGRAHGRPKDAFVVIVTRHQTENQFLASLITPNGVRDLNDFVVLARGGWYAGFVPALESLLLVLAQAISHQSDRLVDQTFIDGTNAVLTPEQPYFGDCDED